MSLDLASPMVFDLTVHQALEDVRNTPHLREWRDKLQAHLNRVAKATPAQWKDRAFLLALWEDETVTTTGMGRVRIQPALDDPDFVQWLGTFLATPLPADRLQAEASLRAFHDELESRSGALCGRVPRLKNNRLMCSRWPDYFTSLADVGKLETLYRAMTGRVPEHSVQAHILIRQRIDDALAREDVDVATRICISWGLYSQLMESMGTTGMQAQDPQSRLPPLPASLRRKGLTALRGYFPTLLTFLPALAGGVTREELADQVRQSIPGLSESSVGTTINVLVSEHGVAYREGSEYRLTPRGINLYRTQDPFELADHLLTRILGTDHVVKALEQKALNIRDIVGLLKKANPGWTSDYAPRALLYWLASLGVVTSDGWGNYELTPAGQQWAELVTWTPECLKPAVAPEPEKASTQATTVTLTPAFDVIHNALTERTRGKLVYDRELIQRLHAGLWFHPVRHFAVLTGISGSGKTQLALNYAMSLLSTDNSDADTVRLIPVQPGWFDPSPLLGYINPLQPGVYRSAPFLELLLAASEDPATPYVAILDEMNLSHPEQYLAPVLSAMETEGWIELHDLPEDTTEVPPRVRYPRNLAIIGTLNMDETTHGLSDKVLDRAYTLEFWDIDVAAFPGWQDAPVPAALRDQTRAVLEALAHALSPVRLHFGWRTIHDVLAYLAFSQQHYGNADSVVLDEAVYARVLPKLRGESTPRFNMALGQALQVLQQHGLKRCAAKVDAMRTDLGESGSTRFWR